jgi:plasmid stability protein
MADVAVRGLAADVHAALREAAVRNHRSINGEILARLEASVRPEAVDLDALLLRIRERGSQTRLASLDDDAIHALTDAGRP